MIEENAIHREDDGLGGRYVMRLPDGSVAQMTYRRGPGDTIIANHTYVPPAHRGRGIAERLVGTAVDDARRDGMKIVPLCSFVAAQFRRHPDWADLRA